ncbi:hypothetical protein AW736_17385 [Termitidicoccus mucosus]|uniref:Autotransporter domain-containing protein n=1 Tax=Termitidicoccus mucosus TaxID=1184151 RepID=A0A178IIA1_9BACT|nr:hypothetical protein AW736_17385 [Opitutaceae bacterium TSB47]
MKTKTATVAPAASLREQISVAVLFFAAFALLAAPARADIHQVEPATTINSTVTGSWASSDTIVFKGDVQLGYSPGYNDRSLVFQSDIAGVTRVIDAAGFRFAALNSGVAMTLSDIEIKNSVYSNNGGAFTISGGDTTGTTSLLGSFAITSATALNSGGAIHAANGSLLLGSAGGLVTFAGNMSGTAIGANGGAVNISTAGATLTVAGSSIFNDNIAGGGGGAVNIGTGDLVFKGNASFSRNIAGNGGAAIKAAGSILFEKDAFFASNTMTGTANSLGGAIHAANGLTILGNATFQDNRSEAGQRGGGAIYVVAGNLSISGTSLFSNNYSRINGGAIYYFPAGTITFGSYVTATGNTAGTGGGAIHSQSGDIYLLAGGNFSRNNALAGSGGALHLNTAGHVIDVTGYTVISSNTAVQNGGGIYAASPVTFRDGVEMRDNTVTGGPGGAIRHNNAASAVTITGPFAFTGNTASLQGGAIATIGSLSLIGSGSFTGNRAGTTAGSVLEGGAIILEATTAAAFTATLAATTGDIVFRDNRHRVSDDGSGVPNAIYLKNITTGAGIALNLEATEGNSINFYDPIASAVDATAKFAIAVTKTGAGSVLFDQYQSAIVADTAVAAGAFKLTGGAIYGADSGTGSFTVASGATLAGNGIVRANAITIANGATLEALEGGSLAFDSAGTPVIGTGLTLAGSGTIAIPQALDAAAVRVGEAGATAAQTLSLTGNLTLADGAVLRHDLYAGGAADLLAALGDFALTGTATIDLGAVDSGTFTLMSWAGSGLAASDTTKFAITANGAELTARNHASIDIDDGAKTLSLTNQVVSLGLTWTGSENAVWTSAPGSTANWTDGAANAENYFRDGDSVLFDGDGSAAGRTVTLADALTASQVRVIGGGTHTFTGTGGLTTDAASVLDGSAVATGTSGKLVKEGAGELVFENTGPNTFTAGIDHSGGVISFTDAAQIATGPGAAITLSNSAALRAAAGIADLANSLTVTAAADTGVFDTGTFAVGYSGQLSGAGTLVKTGSGALTFAGNASAAFAGTTRVDQGALLLASAATLGGDVTATASGAIVGGAGAFSGNVSVSNVTLRVGGLSTSSTLIIGGTLALHDATLTFGLFTGTLSDVLTIDAGGTLAVSGSNTIDINAPEIGVYTLGNIAELDGATVTIDGQTQVAGGRQQAVLSSTTGNLLLLTYNADQSRNLVWTGSTGGAWNNADSNWDGSVSKFAAGDSVTFTGSLAASHTIAIAGGGARVSDLFVEGADDFTFTGAGITGDSASLVLDSGTSEVTGAQGRLVKTGAGTLTLANAVNTFLGGIDLSGGAIAFSTAAQLGTGTAAITFSGEAILRANAGNIILSNTLAIADGVTASIDTGAHTLTLAGAVTGTAGTLAKLGDGTPVYSGTAALGHAATRIDAGVVALRNIIATDAPSVAHAFTFNGGWLDLSDTTYVSDGSAANDWSLLAFSGSLGGVIGSNDKITLGAGDHAFAIGHATDLAKQGVFVVVDAGAGVATMTGANNYAGYTLLKSGTLRVTADSQLGLASLNREIVFDGAGAALELGDGFASARALELRQNGEVSVAAAATATLSGAITGSSSTLTKTGDGTLVLTGAAAATAPGFSIAAGTLQGNTDSLRGNIANAGTLVFDQASDGAYAGVVTGAGVFEKRGAGVLTLSQASAYTGATRVLAGTLKAGAAGVLNAASAHSVSGGAILDLGGFDQTVAGLAADGSVILDATFNPDAGLIGRNNKLTVSGALTGSGTMLIRLALDETMSTGAASVDVIDAGAGSDTSQLKAVLSQRVTDGIFDLGAAFDAGGNLTLAAAMVSPEVPAATAIPTLALLMGQAGLDSAAQRLGELRVETDRLDSLWARGIYREDRVTGELFDGTDVRTRGFQVGADHLFPGVWGDGSRLVLGVFFDAFDAGDSHPSPGAELDGQQRALGLYGTLAKGNWYVDGLARYGKTEYDVNAPDDRLRVKGNGLAFALETGYAFHLLGRIEPSVQAVWQDQSFDDNADRFSRDYRFGSTTSLQARGGIRWSTNIPFDTHSSFAPWLRVSGGYEFDADQKIGISGFWFDNDLGGSLFTVEGGVTFLLGTRASLYASGMWTGGGNIDSTSASVGLRYSW